VKPGGGALSVEGFTSLAAEALRTSRPELSVEIVRDLLLRIHAPSGREAMVQLGNLLTEARRDPQGPGRALHRLIESANATLSESGLSGSPAAGTGPSDAARERECILPLLRHVDQIVRMWSARPGAPRLPAQAVVGPVWCCYGFDLPGAVQIVSREAADRLALTDARLASLAVDNLRRRLTPELIGDGPLWQVVCGGTYDAAFLLDDALWETISLRVPGTLAVALPARDVLLLTSLAIPGGLVELKRVASRARTEVDHPLWDGVLVRTAEGWVVSPGSASAAD
jgi:hypothetical protein